MIKNALGLIEVVGLAAGMEAADAAMKAANIELIGYELSKGGGLVVIKICGDVGAVKAAVEAATAAASKLGKVYASHVIPRPASGLERMIASMDNVGKKPAPDKDEPPGTKELEEAGEVDENRPAAQEKDDAGNPISAEHPDAASGSTGVCNLCGDPACQRRKGDPKTTCIHKRHYEED